MATFYRIVQSNPPASADFISDRDAGRSAPGRKWLHTWDGFSVMDSEAGARELVAEYSRLGGFIAAVDVEEGSGIRAERTHNREGHYTMWGDPEVILAHVRSVVPA